MKSIVEQLSLQAVSRPDKTVLIAEGEQVSYSGLWKAVTGFGAYISGLGLSKGSRIVIKAMPSISYAVALFGIHLSGNVAVPVEKTIGYEGLKKIAAEINACAIISDTEPVEGYISIATADVRKLAEETEPGGDTVFPDEYATADILFTTGTTGKSKGVMEGHHSVAAIAENIMYSDGILEDDVYLIPVPLNHANGIRKFFATITAGATTVFLDGFTDLRKFYESIDAYHATGLLLPPSAIRMILLLSADRLGSLSGQIRFIHSGTAPLPEADKEKLRKLLPGVRLLFAYGSSEAGSATSLDFGKYDGLVSCIGKPQKNARVFIVDEDHNEIQSDSEHQGLIAIGGDVIMQGYYNEPELTAGVLKDGVIYTNDIGYIDENGFVYMLGRKGDVINIGGLKIAPTEVENVVMRFPGVAECAFFGKEDRHGNISLRLNIVVEKDKQVDTAELKNHMSAHLESFKLPKTIVTVGEIPKTSNGKIDRKRLE